MLRLLADYRLPPGKCGCVLPDFRTKVKRKRQRSTGIALISSRLTISSKYFVAKPTLDKFIANYWWIEFLVGTSKLPNQIALDYYVFVTCILFQIMNPKPTRNETTPTRPRVVQTVTYVLKAVSDMYFAVPFCIKGSVGSVVICLRSPKKNVSNIKTNQQPRATAIQIWAGHNLNFIIESLYIILLSIEKKYHKIINILKMVIANLTLSLSKTCIMGIMYNGDSYRFNYHFNFPS